MIVVVLLLCLEMASGDRTVLVTPRPRWSPKKLAVEPKGDTSSPGIPPRLPIRRPVINLRVLPHSGKHSLISAVLPVEHRHHPKGKEVIVESVPVHRLNSPLRSHLARPQSQKLAKPIVVPPQRGFKPIVVASSSKPMSSFSQRPIVVEPSMSLEILTNHIGQGSTYKLDSQQGGGSQEAFQPSHQRGSFQQGLAFQLGHQGGQQSQQDLAFQFGQQGGQPSQQDHSFNLGHQGGQLSQQGEGHVFVESLPSLSVKLEEGNLTGSLADFLTPPKYPSVYDKQFVQQKSTSQPLKKKKKTKKPKKQKLDDSSENEVNTSDNDFHKFKTQSSGERVEFQLHGQNGPESYKFGFDTGAGKNRQFRFEEKDGLGNVKGHFGYYDTTGKLQIFNYRADKNGFHAEQVD